MSYQKPNTGSPGPNTNLWADLVRNARLAWRLLRDPRVTKFSKFAIPALTALYVLSPIDILPDVFPVLGQLDDLAILALAVKLFIQLAPPEVVAEHQANLSGTNPPPGETVDATYRVIK